MIELSTERLTLRRWLPADLGPLSAIYADAEVMRYIGDGSIWTSVQTEASIAMMEAEWDERGFSMFAIERRESPGLIGWAGLTVASQVRCK